MPPTLRAFAPSRAALLSLFCLGWAFTASAETRLLRLVSAPDLINADVEYNAPRAFDMDETDPDYAARRQVVIDARASGGVTQIPSHPHDFNNDGILSIQEGYRGGMQDMLEQIAAENPDAFLASGDLIDGEWATKPGKQNTGAALSVRQQHVRTQGDIYYDAYFDNFRDAGYDGPIFGVIGDHEIGDNNWGSDKVALVPTFFEVYRDKMVDIPETVAGDGAYVDTPVDREGRWWAKQFGNVLLMGIETFDIRYNSSGNITAIVTDSAGTKKILIPQDHLDWIEATLQTAQADPTVEHIIIMGHSPFDVPGVRTASSSNLRIGGGTSSDLWQLFETYDVTLYLAGEVHAVSGYKANGVTQLVTAGNQFSSAESNYLVIDVYSDRILLTLKEAFKTVNGSRTDASDPINDDNSKSAEWRARHPYRIVGTATLYTGGASPALLEQTGQLASFVIDNDNASDPASIPPITIDPAPVPALAESILPIEHTLRRLSTASLGDAFDEHPGVALTLKPARNSVVLYAVANQWNNPFDVEPIIVNGREYPLQELASSTSSDITTYIYGAEIGDINEEQNVTIGTTLFESSGAEKGRRNACYAVQLANATLAGYGSATARASSASDKPVSASFSGFDANAFIITIGGFNRDSTNFALDSGLDDFGFFNNTNGNGQYRGGSGFFDNATTTSVNWTSSGNFKGAGLASVVVNAFPELSMEEGSTPDSLKFSWHSAVGTGPELEATSGLTSGSWDPVPETPVLNGDQYEVEVDMTEPREFFRLRVD